MGSIHHLLAGELLANLVCQVAVRFAVFKGAVGQLDKGLVNVPLGCFAPGGDFVNQVLFEGFFSEPLSNSRRFLLPQKV